MLLFYLNTRHSWIFTEPSDEIHCINTLTSAAFWWKNIGQRLLSSQPRPNQSWFLRFQRILSFSWTRQGATFQPLIIMYVWKQHLQYQFPSESSCFKTCFLLVKLCWRPGLFYVWEKWKKFCLQMKECTSVINYCVSYMLLLFILLKLVLLR